jgi:DNA-directed RNA polymerase subunit E"
MTLELVKSALIVRWMALVLTLGYRSRINMAKQPFACGECNRILPEPENKNDVVQCKNCPNAPLTTDWQGYVIILNPERSEVAARLNVKSPGTYALKVNIR